MLKNKIALLFTSIFALTACSNTVQSDEVKEQTSKQAIPMDQLKPALVESSAENTARLNAAVSRALNGTQVNLAADAFTVSNKLMTERMMQNKLGHEGMNGRLLPTPDNASHHFSLYRHGNMCYLVYEKTGKQVPIEGLACKSL